MEKWDPEGSEPGEKLEKEGRDPHVVPTKTVKEFLVVAAVQHIKEEANEDQEQLENVQTSHSQRCPLEPVASEDMKANQSSWVGTVDGGPKHQEKCTSPSLASLGEDASADTDCLDSSIQIKEEDLGMEDAVKLEDPHQHIRKFCIREAEWIQEMPGWVKDTTFNSPKSKQKPLDTVKVARSHDVKQEEDTETNFLGGSDAVYPFGKETFPLERQMDIIGISQEKNKMLNFQRPESKEIPSGGREAEKYQENLQRNPPELEKNKSDLKESIFQEGVLRNKGKPVSSECGKKTNTCAYCGKVLKCRADLLVHERTHTGEKPYECAECGQSFSQKGNLVSHVRIHTGEKPYKCMECGQSFIQSSHLLTHKRTHTGEKPHKCSDCGKSFNQKGSLVIHKRKHSGQKPYQCSECEKSFSTSYQFINHKRLHTGEKPFTCSDCGQSFNWKSNLIKHQRIHTGEKPYECSVCKKSFSDKPSLAKHVKTHTEEKPYKCSDCGHSFHLKAGLMTHLRTHSGEKPYTCPECGKNLSYRSSLKAHMRTHTGEKPYECFKCGKTFVSSSDCRKHARVHTVEKRGRKCPLIPESDS